MFDQIGEPRFKREVASQTIKKISMGMRRDGKMKWDEDLPAPWITSSSCY